jgi:hypothetical protein
MPYLFIGCMFFNVKNLVISHGCMPFIALAGKNWTAT